MINTASPNSKKLSTPSLMPENGIVLLHAATWSHPWKGYNDRFVAGRTPSHGKGEFEVTITDAGHAVTAEVPASFKITDENYRIHIPDRSKVHVCAENAPDGDPQANPSVWVVKDPKTRIVCLTLGHDADAHDNPAFKTLFTNAVNWVANRQALLRVGKP
jgi:type 1 glutamine amidotransferase